MRPKNFSAILLTSISVLALSACGSSDTRNVKADAPMPPISEMDAAMNSPAPQTLSGSDTLTPVMPSASESGDVESRMAKLEASVNTLRADYDRIMPAFATLNTTNDRIQKLLGEIEKETGIPSAPVASTTTVTTTTEMTPPPPVTGVLPPAGTVSKANKPVSVTETTTVTTTEKDLYPKDAAPPLASFKTQPSVEEARAEAARQTGKTEAVEPAASPAKSAGAVAGSGGNSVKGIRIGEHGAKTRLVFDLTGNTKPDVKYDVDAGEKLLMVEMPGTGWGGAATGNPKSPLIESWSVQKGTEGGSTLAVQLKKNARVVSTEFLKAEGANSARLVMDIAAGG